MLVVDDEPDARDLFSLIRKIRQLPVKKGGNIPAIAVTAFAKPEDRVAAISAGFQAHVSKPMDPTDLLRIVAAAAKPG